MRKLLTTLLPLLNSLKQSNLHKNNLLPILLLLTTHLLPCTHKSFLYIMFMQNLYLCISFCQCINFIAIYLLTSSIRRAKCI